MEDLSEVFKALGDPTRLRILQMLAENGEVCVCKIQEVLEMGQSAVSHHMAALRHAGLVSGRREGQWIHYRINEEALRDGPLAYPAQVRNLLDRRQAEPLGVERK